MRIISCHIENFGGLNKVDMEFNEGLNVILRENGWGKSTLAAFIKAMLYGLPSSTKRSLFENERKRYTPWQCGNFGGSMVFETEGNTYRVERFFGAKESDDSFMLYNEKTQLVSHDYTQNLGVEIFGIDADSFEKTVFLPQKSIESKMTDSISAKLTHLLESGDDINNFESALNNLADIRRNYALLRGNGGKIYDNEQRLHNITQEIESCESYFEILDETEEKLRETEEGIKKQENELKSLETELKAAEEYELKKEKIERLASIKNKIEESKRKTEEVSRYFEKGMPNQEDIDLCRENITALTQIDANILALKNSTDSITAEKIRGEYFKGSIPKAAEVEKIAALCGNLGDLGSRAAEEEALYRQNQAEAAAKNKSKVILGIALIILGIALSAVSVILFLQTLWLFIALIICGVALTAAGIILLMRKSAEIPFDKKAVLELEEAKKQIDDFLSKYSRGGERVAAVYEVKEKLTALNKIEGQNSKNAEEISQNSRKREEIDRNIREFLNKYGIFDMSVGYASCLDKICESRTKLLIESERQRALKAEAEEFLKNNDIEQLSQPLNPPEDDIDTLKAAILHTRQSLEYMGKSVLLLNRKKLELESKTEVYNDLLSEKEYLEGQIAGDRKRVEIIDKTKEFLEKARENLSTGYLDKMTEGFKKYTDEICKMEDYRISTDLDVAFKREGKSRSLDFFSTGYRALVNFCMRLSMTDALYSGEQPFLILDDPFVNLDDDKHEKIRNLLEKLAQNRQIIYFVCRKDA